MPPQKNGGYPTKYLTGCAVPVAIGLIFDPRAPSEPIQAPRSGSLHPQNHSRYSQPFALLRMLLKDPRNDDVTNKA